MGDTKATDVPLIGVFLGDATWRYLFVGVMAHQIIENHPPPEL